VTVRVCGLYLLHFKYHQQQTRKLVPKQILELSLSLSPKNNGMLFYPNIVACVFLCSQPSGNVHTQIIKEEISYSFVMFKGYLTSHEGAKLKDAVFLVNHSVRGKAYENVGKNSLCMKNKANECLVC
jgi:hypothetical protein